MNQTERNELSRARILMHASAEFAEHGYHGASVNRICEKGKVSKGLMYHYYKEKDDLYLSCIKMCFSRIGAFILAELDKDSITVDEFFDRRATYFEEHPVHYYLYLDAITNISPHIQKYRVEYDNTNYKIFSTVIKNQYSDANIDINFAFKMLTIMRRGVNSYIGTQKSESFSPADHAALCKQVVNTVIRGLS